jgi:hypothetical protein
MAPKERKKGGTEKRIKEDRMKHKIVNVENKIGTI